MWVAARAGYVGSHRCVRNNACRALTVVSDIQRSSRYDADDARDFPTAHKRLQHLVLAILQERDLVDEVGEENLPPVKAGPSVIVLPTQVGIGNIVEVSSASPAVERVVGVGIGVPKLICQ